MSLSLISGPESAGAINHGLSRTSGAGRGTGGFDQVQTSPLLVDIQVAARMYSVSTSTFARHADSGLVPGGVKLGGRRLWNVAALEAHIAAGCKPVRAK